VAGGGSIKDLRSLVAPAVARSNGHMVDVRSTWNDAGERFQVLGASLKQHYVQQRREGAEREKGQQAADAFTKAGDALQAAFDALASAANDPAVRQGVKEAGSSVADALAATFAEVAEEIRRPPENAPPAAEPGTREESPQDRKDPDVAT
jgi:hypothetical protein